MRFDYEAFGSAFLTMRLHRLRVLLTEQCDDAFNKLGVTAPSFSTSVVLFLAEQGQASIAQIARATGYSHQLVNLRLAALEQSGLSERLADPHDKRKCVMVLTRQGRAEAKKLEAALDLLAKACDGLFEELGLDLGEASDRAVKLLEAEPIMERMQSSRIRRKKRRVGQSDRASE